MLILDPPKPPPVVDLETVMRELSVFNEGVEVFAVVPGQRHGWCVFGESGPILAVCPARLAVTERTHSAMLGRGWIKYDGSLTYPGWRALENARRRERARDRRFRSI